MESQCSSARIPPCAHKPVWQHPTTGYVYCEEHWQSCFANLQGIRIAYSPPPEQNIPVRRRVIDLTLGVPLVTYAAFFFAFWIGVGMARIALRRWRMLLPPQQFAYLNCHAQGHQFGLFENICEHCGAERFDTTRLKLLKLNTRKT